MNIVDKAIEAISAREAGVFDDPSLLEIDRDRCDRCGHPYHDEIA
jgi:hypothetical protein